MSAKASTPPNKESTKPVKPTPVKKTVKKKTTKRKPKAPPVTREMFEAYFFKLSNKDFVQLTQQWNEEKLKVRIVKKTNYDEWFNYFKGFSANSIRMLATTGLDFLPTEAYAALARWHDIIANPARIDKIHQAGLINPNRTEHSIVAMALANDRLGVLKATRDQIAEKLEKGAGARDTASLAHEMTEIMTEIANYEKRAGPKKQTKLGELMQNMDDFKPRAKNKGARNTSFKSRVTIGDVEN